jgi:hypothetical protein
MKMLGVLLSNLRGVCVVKNAAHAKFVMDNLLRWTVQRNLVPGFTKLPKPADLAKWEQKTKDQAPSFKCHSLACKHPLSLPTQTENTLARFFK